MALMVATQGGRFQVSMELLLAHNQDGQLAVRSKPVYPRGHPEGIGSLAEAGMLGHPYVSTSCSLTVLTFDIWTGLYLDLRDC